MKSKIIVKILSGLLVITLFASCRQNIASESLQIELSLLQMPESLALLESIEMETNTVRQATEQNLFAPMSYSSTPNDFSIKHVNYNLNAIAPTRSSKTPPINEIASFFTRNASENTYVGGIADYLNPNYNDSPYSPLGIFAKKILDGLSAFEGLKPANIDNPSAVYDFVIWTKDGVRHVYGIGKDGHFIADGKAYILPQNKRKAIEELQVYMLSVQNSGRRHGFTFAYPQWLVWMRPHLITEIIFHSPTRGPLPIRPELFEHAIIQVTQAVEPKGNSTYALGSVDFSGKGVFHLEIRFKGGIIYNIYATNGSLANFPSANLYVQSSDMSYGLKYTTLLASVNGAANFMIDDFERIAKAKTAKDVENPAT